MNFRFKKGEKSRLLEPGQPAPDFSLPATTGENIQLSELQGQSLILAFYPKDNTAVCASQMALYNEVLDMFQDYNAVLLGISVDNLDTHQTFAASLKLDFPLLSDAEPKGEAARLYGVFDEKMQISQRALFVIDKDGIIQWSYLSPPGINPGADGILNALEQLP